ncbi:glucosidase 2 subunit beta-like [Antedon mediterranea]|uniref:glucosidase 2 subunit beta-like n=1 Tax=Antedon mediterranea TaxID=105859 RepID=UPI003AF696C1
MKTYPTSVSVLPLCFLFIFQCLCCDCTRLRGVSISKESFYSDSPWFTCIDGSGKIPFSKVNDDYCDCKDSSDEPGTSACPNGKFHCTNAGHRPKYIPSSWVNDGICDCCDATDENKGSTQCVNTCKELGKADREKRHREALLQNEGFDIRQSYIVTGQTKRKEREEQLQHLKVELQSAEQLKEDKEAIKISAEEPEKKSKEEHENKWKEEVKIRKKELERETATSAFDQLDANNDSILTSEEIMKVQGFDTDHDGAVSQEEAMNILGQDQVDKESFITRLWTDGGFKIIFSELNKQNEKHDGEDIEAIDLPPPDVASTQHPVNDDDVDDYEDYDEDEHEHDHEAHEDEDLRKSQEIKDAVRRNKERREKMKQDEEGEMPDWNEDTKKLIEVADNARLEYDEANKKYNDINNQISTLEKLQTKDFGPDQEFAILQDQCFEYTDREYTYKLCPFDKSTQRPKNGGAETSLGTWGEWDGPPDDKYSLMKYTRGKGCWNGPDRSTNVKMTCGKENAVLSATEPERCVYQFEFTTPALCKTQISINENEPLHPEHTEL